MTDMAKASFCCVVLALGVIFGVAPVLGPDANQVLPSMLTLAPYFHLHFKRRRIRKQIRSGPPDIFREGGLSWQATVIYGVLLYHGSVSAVGLVQAFLQRGNLAQVGISDNLLVFHIVGAGSLPTLLLIFFLMGKLFALCRTHRLAAFATVLFAGPLVMRLVDFLLIPTAWFEVSFPGMGRGLWEFGYLLMWAEIVFAIPLTLGALWYMRSAARLRVASAMRLLPQATQATIADLVRDELREVTVSSSRGPSDAR